MITAQHIDGLKTFIEQEGIEQVLIAIKVICIEKKILFTYKVEES